MHTIPVHDPESLPETEVDLPDRQIVVFYLREVTEMGKRSTYRSVRFKCCVETKIEDLVQQEPGNRSVAHLVCFEEQKVTLEFPGIELLADHDTLVGV